MSYDFCWECQGPGDREVKKKLGNKIKKSLPSLAAYVVRPHATAYRFQGCFTIIGEAASTVST